jgi:hypothetical protein
VVVVAPFSLLVVGFDEEDGSECQAGAVDCVRQVDTNDLNEFART